MSVWSRQQIVKIVRGVSLMTKCPACKSKKISLTTAKYFWQRKWSDGHITITSRSIIDLDNICEDCGLEWKAEHNVKVS